jgi:hypothetical protein
MSKFKKGETVTHLARGVGTVTKIEDGAVHVTFNELDSKGRPVVGIYDDNWLRINPGLLVAGAKP